MSDKATAASYPRSGRATRQRSANPSAHGSAKLGPVVTTDTVADMRLDSRTYYGYDEEAEEEEEEDADEEEDDGDDSASVYQDSGSFTPPPLRPATSSKASSKKPLAQTSSSDPIPASPTNITAHDITTPLSGSLPGTTTTAPGGAPPNKRGRKPAPASSRGAREQARKTNHSRIEKRRREKINDALATLRDVVPIGIAEILEQLEQASPGASPALSAVGAAAAAAVATSAATRGSIGGANEKGKKKAGAEKEFKLEVLERTVVFVKYLLERVDELEAQVRLTQTPSNSTSTLNVCLPFLSLLGSS